MTPTERTGPHKEGDPSIEAMPSAIHFGLDKLRSNSNQTSQTVRGAAPTGNPIQDAALTQTTGSAPPESIIRIPFLFFGMEVG